MLPELSHLIDLHVLDKEIFELNQSLEELPREVQGKDQEIAALETERSSYQEEMDGLKGQLREMEGEVADLEEGIKSSRQRLMEIGKELELKAMLKEIGFREDQRDQKETRVLELLDQVGSLSKTIAEQDQALSALKSEHDRLSGEVAAQVADLEKKRDALLAQREALRQRLPAQLLKRYEFILRRHNGSAICEVQDGVCLGCHLNILPQQYIDLQKGEDILQCPNCQRILYWLGEEAEEEVEVKASTKARKVS